MSNSQLRGVRRASVRVALMATGIVAIGYLLIAVGTILIVSQRQTAAVDEGLNHALSGPARRFPVDEGAPRPPGAPGSAAPAARWVILANGDMITINSDLQLPPEDRHVSGPQTITLGAERMRVRGRPIGDTYVVVGRPLEPLEQAQLSLVGAELLVAPILLTAVFLGALTVGRRVAVPIERARQRQLELTADASHELRTPLSVIEAEASLALAGRRTARWYREAFERIDREAQRMRHLVDDMLWLARFDGQGEHPGAEPVDIGVLAREAVSRFGGVAATRRQHLEMGLPDQALAVTAPPDWLDRMIGVLIDNACRYTPEGGSIRVEVAALDGRIRLAVEDSGPGIPVEDRARVFDRFHRASETPGGAGLGLAIADAVVRATGGRWNVGTSVLGGASMAVDWQRTW